MRPIQHTGIHITARFSDAYFGTGRAAYEMLPKIIQAINIIAEKQSEVIDALNAIIAKKQEASNGSGRT